MATIIARLETNAKRDAEMREKKKEKKENVEFERKGRGRKKEEGSDWASRQKSVV